MILVFDVETTGFVREDLPPTHEAQPYLVQLGAVLCADDGDVAEELDLIVAPDGYEIPWQAAKVHGITTAKASNPLIGVPLASAMAQFRALCQKATVLVAHNLPFDRTVIAASVARTPNTRPLFTAPIKQQDTLTLCTPLLKIPPTEKMIRAGRNHYKSPNLSECYEHFFHEPLVGAHSALVDARATARVYFAALAAIAKDDVAA